MAAYPGDNHAMVPLEQGSSVLPVWEPRVNEVPCQVLRKIREGISGLLGVPHSWIAPMGKGLATVLAVYGIRLDMAVVSEEDGATHDFED